MASNAYRCTIHTTHSAVSILLNLGQLHQNCVSNAESSICMQPCLPWNESEEKPYIQEEVIPTSFYLEPYWHTTMLQKK